MYITDMMTEVLDTRTSVEQHHEVPDFIRAASAMNDPDYVDLFSVTTPNATDHSPEEWARAGLETASAAGRFMAWRVLCALRLHTEPSPDYVAGWRIGERDADWMRLEASSWFMTAHVVVAVQEGRLSIALFVRYDNLVGALRWPPLSVMHRRLMPGLMRHTVRSMARHEASAATADR